MGVRAGAVQESERLLDSPHKVVISPTANLPFGQGRKYLSDNRLEDLVLGGWSITPVITLPLR